MPLSHAPMAVQRLIKRCLRKDPGTRLHDIADAELDIEDAVAESTPLVVPVPGRDPYRVSRKKTLIGGSAALVAAAVIVAGGFWLGSRQQSSDHGTIARLTIPLPSGQEIAHGSLAPMAVSPDGERIVYSAMQREGRTQLFVRAIDQDEPTMIAGSEGASAPFFSPDGRWVGFFANGMLQRVSIDGGAALKIGDASSVLTASWGADGTIVFAGAAAPGGLWRVPAGGGTPERLTTVDPAANEVQHAYPRRLPSGDVLFGVVTDRGWHLAVLTLATKQVRALGQPGSGGAGAQYVQTGHLVYASAGGLVAVPFNPNTGISGSPLPLRERPEVDPSGSAAFAVSEAGTLVYVPRPDVVARARARLRRSHRPRDPRVGDTRRLRTPALVEGWPPTRCRHRVGQWF